MAQKLPSLNVLKMFDVAFYVIHTIGVRLDVGPKYKAALQAVLR